MTSIAVRMRVTQLQPLLIFAIVACMISTLAIGLGVHVGISAQPSIVDAGGGG